MSACICGRGKEAKSWNGQEMSCLDCYADAVRGTLPIPCEVTGVKELPGDQGHIIEYKPTGFVKHDAGKPRFGLIPAEALLEVAKVFTHGAKKYPPGNWRKGTDWLRYLDAAHRHINAWERREDNDTESGLSHLAHAAACMLILLAMQLLGVGTDDRA